MSSSTDLFAAQLSLRARSDRTATGRSGNVCGMEKNRLEAFSDGVLAIITKSPVQQG